MCGIAGFFTRTPSWSPHELESIGASMAATLKHRGPDDHGVWCDEACRLVLAHRRLSIIDLSPSGHQPMTSANGRFVMVFNGEIFNHAELRSRLAHRNLSFRGHSDTEVLLEAIACWGFEQALQQAIGMFACAVWDRQEQRLLLARDRLGIKPLYYGCSGNVFLFASELKALRVHPAFRAEIDRDALAAFVRYNYVPSPATIYRGIHKLTPGTVLNLAADSDPATAEPKSFWRLQDIVAAGQRAPLQVAPHEAVEHLDGLLRNAVRLRMEADVPLGAFLSGGIDSSTVVALMQTQSASPVRTFTIGFSEPAYDEAAYARAVAEHLGTEHVECYVSPADAREVIPQLPAIYDEPFADSSQIPTILLSRITRQHVTVSLSGDGGDELFGGYPRYAFARSYWRKFGWLPWPARRAVARGLRAATGHRLSGRLPCKLRTLATLLQQRTPLEMYTLLNSHWRDPAEVVIGTSWPASHCCPRELPALPDLMDAMMYQDTMNYLPDDILTKVDRASMSVGLEARVPLLDHRVVEFAWSLPLRLKIRDGQPKWILRQVLERYVPRRLIERPKIGFGVPIDSWLRGPLRDWAEDLLAERRLQQDGFFHPAPIREKWAAHLSGQTDWHYLLWDILMFQAWWAEHRQATAACTAG
jgi:asparagine synthase (glutamine-hydrolysing)